MKVSTELRPIDGELVRQHLDRAAAELDAQDAEALFLFATANILGFFGVPLGPSDRLVAGLVTADRQAALVVPELEAGVAGNLVAGANLVCWDEDEDPYEILARAARDLGVADARIVLDGRTWDEARQRLGTVLPRSQLLCDPGVIRAVRICKSDDEIAAIREACQDVGAIYPLIAGNLRAGMTEEELSRVALDELRCRGIQPYGDLIQGGENASVPHRTAGARRFQDGDAVIVDFVARRNGYVGDLTRTFAVGQPDEEIARAYQIVRRAQRAAIDAVRPGITGHEVDAAARGVIESAGLGDYFIHRTGHGIGLEVHEPPYLVRGNSERLEAGMCVTIEPGVYVPGRFGIRIEDVAAVTPAGGEVLSAEIPTDWSAAFG